MNKPTSKSSVSVSEKSYEKLRQIFEKEQGRKITIEKARDIGDHLLNFYETLVGGMRLTKGGLKNIKQNKVRMDD